MKCRLRNFAKLSSGSQFCYYAKISYGTQKQCVGFKCLATVACQWLGAWMLGLGNACMGWLGRGESWRSRHFHRKTDADSSFIWIIQSLVNLWFNSIPSYLSTPTFACCHYLKHVFLVVVTITLLPCVVSTPRYVISIEAVMQSCLPHI
jgi:hypothetical protein